jgi:hypothetical protein
MKMTIREATMTTIKMTLKKPVKLEHFNIETPMLLLVNVATCLELLVPEWNNHNMPGPDVGAVDVQVAAELGFPDINNTYDTPVNLAIYERLAEVYNKPVSLFFEWWEGNFNFHGGYDPKVGRWEYDYHFIGRTSWAEPKAMTFGDLLAVARGDSDED